MTVGEGSGCKPTRKEHVMVNDLSLDEMIKRMVRHVSDVDFKNKAESDKQSDVVLVLKKIKPLSKRKKSHAKK